MNRPEAMSRAHRDAPKIEGPPVAVLTLLAILTLLGIVGTVASVQSARTSSAASKADVEANRRATEQNRVLLEQVRALEQAAKDDVAEHRERNEMDHGDICRLIFEVVQTVPRLAEADLTPCTPRIDTTK